MTVTPTTAPVKTPEAARDGHRGGGHKGNQRTAYLYILPALIIVVGIIYLGVGYNGWVSTLKWNGIDDNQVFIGLDNYRELLGDTIFWDSLKHIAIFGVIVTIVQMVIGLAMALILNGPVFARGLYKVLIFMPVVLAPAAVSVAFRQILSPTGQFNQLLDSAGFGFLGQEWLADPKLALYALAAINIWQWTGFSFILYQAALSQIDENLFEAAQLDGAGTWRTVRSIVIPQLKGTHATLALIGAIGAIKTFDIVYITTGGGPGRATEFLTTYIYKEAVNQYHSGYAATLSIVLLVLALILTGIQMRAYKYGEE